MFGWRRVEPVGATAVITSVFLMIGAAFVVLVTVHLIRGATWVVNPVLGMLAFYGFMAFWLGLFWRMNRTGIYTSTESLRITHPWRPRTFAWAEVAKIYSQPAMLLGMATLRNAIWIRLRDGTRIETPVQCRITTSYRSGVRKNVGPILSPTDYEATLLALREAQKRATPG